MKAAFAVLALSMVGCSPVTDDPDTAMYRYQCTEAKMQKVANETQFCTRQTDYSSSHCYNTAIMRNCEPRTNVPGQLTAAPARKDGDA